MDIQPIRTADDHAKALRAIEALWGAESGTPDGDKLDILITLVDRYEDEHFPIEAAHPIDVIKTHMDMTGRKQADLAALIGSASRASEILNRRRYLTIDMVHKLHKEWGIPADCLVLPYELEPPQRRRA
ncbi:transcriptional regulator [Rhizobium sp. 2MFCol3.1]|uniref:helix-turn-helix domain-containing protein n=1 Tax=Rhizobium sp. 2MFCol3.1 TaxID=1246459 RepID=UPI00036FF84A|nr:transcriptional regulator [Rhizobium sp. 2MFCol3.1]